MDKIPVVTKKLSNKWKIEKTFAVIALVSATSDGSSSDIYEIAGIFKTEAEAIAANIRGWFGAYSKVQPVLVLADNKEAFLIFPRGIDYGELRGNKRIYLGTEHNFFKVNQKYSL